MSTASSMPRSAASAGPEQAEQVYVTHCQPADSVEGFPGFGLRATTPTTPGPLRRFAANYPPYEVSAELRRNDLTEPHAPRRLALVRGPDDTLALVHTAYVEFDSAKKRRHSFFSHVLFYPALTLRQALSTWDSPDWVLDYESGKAKTLKPFSGFPRPRGLNDRTLTDFLQGVAGTDGGLAGQLIPPRLPADPLQRQQTLRRVLQGVRQVCQGGGTGREQLFILGEPGLIALLLYGASRLLPEGRDRCVTFSTYEAYHRAFREYRLSQVVGTCTGNPAEDLDPEYYTTRGYALNTYTGKASPELDEPLPAMIQDMFALAGEGQWEDIDDVFRILGGKNVSSVSLTALLEARRAFRAVEKHQGQPADLLQLAPHESGRKLLARPEHRAHVSRLLLEGSLAGSPLCQELRQTLPEMLRWPEVLQELTAQAARALRNNTPEQWEPRWELLRHLLDGVPGQPAQAQRQVLEQVCDGDPVCKGLSPLRLNVLRDSQALQGPRRVPPECHALLRPRSAPEVEQLARAGLTPAYLATALCLGLGQPETQGAALQTLGTGDAPLVEAFCAEAHALQIGVGLIWPMIRDGRLSHPAVLRSFAAVLEPQHLEELQGQCVRLLSGSSPGSWGQRWAILRLLHQGSPDPLRHGLAAILSRCGRQVLSTRPLAVRLELLREWEGLCPAPGSFPEEDVFGLLDVADPAQLPQLVSAPLSAAQRGRALALALRRPELQDAALRLLAGADPALLAAFCQQAGPLGLGETHLWPMMLRGELPAELLADSFPELVRQKLPALIAQAAQALRLPQDGQQKWLLVRRLLREDPARCLEALRLVLKEACAGPEPIPAEHRRLLLQECQQRTGTASPPAEVLPLLKPRGAEDFREILAALSQPTYLGMALCQALTREETSPEATATLAGSDGAARAFCGQLSRLPLEAQQKILGQLLPAGDPQALARLEHLVRNGLSLQGDGELAHFLDKVLRLYSPELLPHWLEGDRLLHILDWIQHHPKASQHTWNTLARHITVDLILADSPRQRQLFDQLYAASRRLPHAVSRKAAEILDDWALLYTHLEGPAALEGKGDDLADACQRRDIRSILQLLREYFRRRVLPRGLSQPVLGRFWGSIRGFLIKPGASEPERRMLHQWLAILKGGCPDRSRKDYQLFFFQHYIRDDAVRLALAADYVAAGDVEPEVHAALLETSAGVPAVAPERTTPPPRTAPAPVASPPVPPVVTTRVPETEPQPAHVSRPPVETRRQGFSRNQLLLLGGLIALLLTVMLAVVILMAHLLTRPGKPVQPPTPAAKAPSPARPTEPPLADRPIAELARMLEEGARASGVLKEPTIRQGLRPLLDLLGEAKDPEAVAKLRPLMAESILAMRAADEDEEKMRNARDAMRTLLDSPVWDALRRGDAHLRLLATLRRELRQLPRGNAADGILKRSTHGESGPRNQ